MILDPDNRFIRTIIAQCDLAGKTVLEIGCGSGRITRDLACHAARVVAVDPDESALGKARSLISASNVEFICTDGTLADLAEGNFDVVIYTLSLHHIQPDKMSDALLGACQRLQPEGRLLVLEPGDTGALMEAKSRFGAGSGDETAGKLAAIRALANLPGWRIAARVSFSTLFQFRDEEDFFQSMLPGLGENVRLRQEISSFLSLHKSPVGIMLDAERRLDMLERVTETEQGDDPHVSF